MQVDKWRHLAAELISVLTLLSHALGSAPLLLFLHPHFSHPLFSDLCYSQVKSHSFATGKDVDGNSLDLMSFPDISALTLERNDFCVIFAGEDL